MREKITASEGKILTNGEIYGTMIYLAEGVDKSTFYEITRAEYDAMMEAQSEETDNEIM